MSAPRFLGLGLAAWLLPTSALAASAFTAHDVLLPGELARPAAADRPFADPPATRAAGLGPGWKVQIDARTGFVRMAYGGRLTVGRAIHSEEDAESLARGFVFSREDLLGVRSDNSRLLVTRRAPGKWAVHFQQVIDGARVWGGTAFVLLGENGRVAAFGSSFERTPERVAASPLVSSSAALAIATGALGATPRADTPIVTEEWWTQARSPDGLELVRAWRVIFESEEPFGQWQTFVDERTGEVLGRQNLYQALDVTGHSEGNVPANPPTYDWCSGNGSYPFEHQTVSIVGGESGVTDENGNVTIPHAGTDPVTINMKMSGPYALVHRVSGATDANWTTVVTPGTPFSLYWTTDHSEKEERFLFYWINHLHDFMKEIDPGLTEADANPVVAFTEEVGGICPGSAWAQGRRTLHFCRQITFPDGTTWFPTGLLSDYVGHEYGHLVTVWLYPDPGPSSALGHGNGDVLAVFSTGRRDLGGGASTLRTCTTRVRSGDNSFSYPFVNDFSEFGWYVILGFHWMCWQELRAVLPPEEADRVAFADWHFGRSLGLPLVLSDQVLWTFLADDDDANLGNGTPHYDQICAAAQAKGFPCPERTAGVFVTHEPLPHATDGSAGFDVTATITSTEAPLDDARLEVSYRVNGGAFQQVLMTPTGAPDEYRAHLPAMGRESQVEYYISAEDLALNSRTSPANAPGSFHAFDVAWWLDDLESGGAGWTVGAPGDLATAGIWELGDPVGTDVQPEDDATTGPGTNCFVTANCTGAGCEPDVNGGTTTLLSPVYDLAGATSAKVKYARWYVNDHAYANVPFDDFWNVDVSNNAGATWTRIEHMNAAEERWATVTVDLAALFGTPGQVRLRFLARDTGLASAVEAGVDDLRILASFEGVGVPAVVANDAPAELHLGAGEPNPFHGRTRLEFAVPRKEAVNLAVYDVGGRRVRTLLSAVRDPGRYRAEWDGRDTAGRPVSAGVYFVRLAAGNELRTRKVTMMQ